MGHSLYAEFYWIKDEYIYGQLYGHRSCPLVYAIIMVMKAILKWVMLALLYCVLILLGIVTAGFFWPKNFRIGVLSVGVEDAYAEMDISAEEKADTMIVKEISCEHRFVLLLIGRRGWTVKNIQNTSGARVDIDQTVNPCKIIISGEVAQVDKALRLVQEVLSYPNAQLHHGSPVAGNASVDESSLQNN